MKCVSVCLAVLLLCVVCVNCQRNLVFSMSVFRHGARTPVHVPPQNYNYVWEEAPGQLLPRGHQQTRQLGEYYRRKYIESRLLDRDPRLAARFMIVRATDMDRTLQSTTNVLKGMFPDVPLVPIPVHSVQRDKDILLTAWESCPAAESLREEQYESEEWAILAGASQGTADAMTKLFGVSPPYSLRTWGHLYDPIKVAVEEKRDDILPQSLDQETIDEILKTGNKVEVQSFLGTSGENQLGDMIGSNLVERFTKIANTWANNDPDQRGKLPRVLLYGAHDTTLLGVLSALDVLDTTSSTRDIPPYCAHVDIDLYTDNTDYWVEVAYGAEGAVSTLTLGSCSGQPGDGDPGCALDYWGPLFAPSHPWDELCDVKHALCAQEAQHVHLVVQFKNVWIALGALSSVLVAVVTALVVRRWMRNRTQRSYEQVSQEAELEL